ncbi:helix-turn-helix domain-containing protein [Actinomadura sp. DC4]|uniref:PucR family transcriptional regulator n=1 Tax=Actinomadura sp. DC4 TaxID=3055069 RepID=UPI0025AEEEEF|nr:helix-turn-helix domain-containing protein [Actinomadura sp. DC4]MDN3357854.1 helix-turn-helix domain-containing protein [Actinomadura sp. DC4]
MPRTLEPDGLNRSRPELAERLMAIMRRELPSLVDEIVGEIRDTIPDYARPIDGPYGRTLRSGVERALAGFVEWLSSPSAPLDDICYKLGRFEAYEGRQLDTLQSAYRIGAQTGWRRVMALHQRHDLAPATVSVLADALFAYMEELASSSVRGYLEAKRQLDDELQAGHRRLLRLIVDGAPRDLLAEHAASVRWVLPDQVTVVVLRPSAPIVRTLLDDDLLTDLDGTDPYLLVPGPLTADRRAMLELAVAESKAAAGLTVALDRAPDSLRWARQALGLVHEEVIDDGPLTLCANHLETLWLFADAPLIDQMARRQLACVDHLTKRQRERLIETLRVWLRTRGTAAQVGEELGVHPQTVRYRMRQIEHALGDDLADADTRFAIEVALRALWLREQTPSPGAYDEPDGRSGRR